MDIGKEDDAIIVEPLEDPFEQPAVEPEREREPVPVAPEREREKV